MFCSNLAYLSFVRFQPFVSLPIIGNEQVEETNESRDLLLELFASFLTVSTVTREEESQLL